MSWSQAEITGISVLGFRACCQLCPSPHTEVHDLIQFQPQVELRKCLLPHPQKNFKFFPLTFTVKFSSLSVLLSVVRITRFFLINLKKFVLLWALPTQLISSNFKVLNMHFFYLLACYTLWDGAQMQKQNYIGLQ